MASVLDVVVASGKVKDGKLYLRNRREFNRTIAQMPESWELEVTIQRRRATRSPQANAYYWAVILEALSLHTGYTVDELHDICKAKFLPKKLALNNGNGEVMGEFVIGGSTRKLNTSEFHAYVESIRQWAAADLDCYTPDPGEA